MTLPELSRPGNDTTWESLTDRQGNQIGTVRAVGYGDGTAYIARLRQGGQMTFAARGDASDWVNQYGKAA